MSGGRHFFGSDIFVVVFGWDFDLPRPITPRSLIPPGGVLLGFGVWFFRPDQTRTLSLFFELGLGGGAGGPLARDLLCLQQAPHKPEVGDDSGWASGSAYPLCADLFCCIPIYFWFAPQFPKSFFNGGGICHFVLEHKELGYLDSV